VENTMRDAADRGYWNLIITDGTAAINDEIHEQSLKMIMYQGGVFGVAASSRQVREALASVR
jgi:nicotinamidase-related amidase